MEDESVLYRNSLSVLHTNLSKQSLDQLPVPKNGHLGIVKTYERIRSSYYWHKMFVDIKKCVFHAFFVPKGNETRS